jgi:hypothetical protein
MMGYNDAWSDEWHAKAVGLWIAGKSGGEIGEALGISRGAVLGHLTRTGVAGPNGSHPRPQVPRSSKPAPRKPKPDKPMTRFTGLSPGIIRDPRPEVQYEPSQTAVRLMDLNERRCKWPVGESGAQLFCGATKPREGPYCSRHHLLAVQPGEKVTLRDLERAIRRYA